MKQCYLFLFLSFVYTAFLMSQNPISPAGTYIADPSAHVWADGKLYVYGSNDESPRYFCSSKHHVLYSSDANRWNIVRDVFASKGDKDEVDYNDEILYAPDCQYRNGSYYLYYCQPSTDSEGVAVSQSPVGPFLNGRKIDTKGYNEIDPAVFIDDDGQAYYIWGQFSAKMAKLKPNMTEIDHSTVKEGVVTEKEHFFHEGGCLIKRKGIYYFIYSHMGRSSKPTCIGYATAQSPMGPFTYRGVIVDNSNCDPGNWNNHGSIVEFNGQWYVFYHRATHNSYVMRKACMEPITFNEDGSINEVEMTTQGAGAPLKADSKIQAEWACLLFGGVYVEAFSSNEEKLAAMKSGNNVAYKYIDFTPEVKQVELRLKPGKKRATIQLVAEQPWYLPFATVDVPPANDTDKWVTVRSKITSPHRVVALWVKVVAEEGDSVDIDWFRFYN